MNRARALAVVTLAAITALGLSGCRVEPGAAAFVGDVRFTDKQIDKIIDEELGKAREQGQQVKPEAIGDTRIDIVDRLVVGELAKRIATAKKISVPSVTAEQVAQERGNKTVSEVDRFIAGTQPYIDAVRASVTPVALGETERKEITAELVRRGAQASVATRFFDNQELMRGTAFRKLLQEEMAKSPVKLSPRYGAAKFVVGSVPNGQQELDLLFLTLGTVDDHGVSDQEPKAEPQQP